MKIVKMTIIVWSVVILTLYVLYNTFLCPYERFQVLQYTKQCWLLQYQLTVIKPMMFLISAILFTSLFTFFISTKTFKRWIIFSTIWMILAALWISQASVRSTGFPSVIPTSKEEVSTWMGSLFVIISLGMFAVMTLREKCAKKTR